MTIQEEANGLASLILRPPVSVVQLNADGGQRVRAKIRVQFLKIDHAEVLMCNHKLRSGNNNNMV